MHALSRMLGCGGAGLHSTAVGSGALLRASSSWMWIVLLFVIGFNAKCSAVCIHCKDTISGCPGGENCPLVKAVGTNVATMASSSLGSVPQVTQLLSPEMLSVFTRPVIEGIVGLHCLPVAGTEVDLTTPSYKAATAVVKACQAGHVSLEVAKGELMRRLEDATEELDVKKISTALDLLSKGPASALDYAGASGYGVLTFIWAKIGQYMELAKSGVVRLPGAAVRASSSAVSELKALVRRPVSQREFFEMLHHWQGVIHALGLANYFIAALFVTKVVFDTITRLGKTWQFAHEFFMVHLRAIETDVARRLHLGNIVTLGHRDVYLAEATANVATFFRTRGGTPQDDDVPNDPNGGGDTVKWNGQWTHDATQCCMAFNFETEHRRKNLKADGTCKFCHKCMQWVSDKGPRGVCGGNHPKSKCNYDPSKRVDQPVKA